MEPENSAPFCKGRFHLQTTHFQVPFVSTSSGGGPRLSFSRPVRSRWQNLALRSAGKRRCLEQDILPVAMKLMEQLGLEEVARQRHGQLDLPTYLPTM